jgi:hypothetical protein
MFVPLSLRTALLLSAAGALVATDALAAQDLHPSRRPSPIGIAKAHVGDTYVKITYGRPYMRGRAIFGDPAAADTTFLVPYGELWRTGANEATEITLTGPVRLAGETLPAGTWSVFTIPGPETWTVKFNDQLGMDGTGRLDPESGTFTPSYDAANDVLAIDVPVTELDEDVDQLTIAFEPLTEPTHLILRWERTEVRIPIEPG